MTDSSVTGEAGGVDAAHTETPRPSPRPVGGEAAVRHIAGPGERRQSTLDAADDAMGRARAALATRLAGSDPAVPDAGQVAALQHAHDALRAALDAAGRADG